MHVFNIHFFYREGVKQFPVPANRATGNSRRINLLLYLISRRDAAVAYGRVTGGRRHSDVRLLPMKAPKLCDKWFLSNLCLNFRRRATPPA